MTNFDLGFGMNSMGGVIQGIANLMATNAMNDALQSQVAKQRGYANQSMGVFSGMLPSQSAETGTKQIAEGSANRQKAYGMATGSQSSVSKGPQADARDKAAIAMHGQQMAGNSAYSDWQLQQEIARIRAQEQINRIASMAGGQASLMPYQMQNAQHSADWMSALGGGLSTAGQVTGMWDFLKPKVGQPNWLPWDMVQLGRQSPY